MGSSAKTGALFWVKNIKVPFGIGHPLTYTSNLVYMCAGGFRGPKSSNNSIISIRSRVTVNLPMWVSLALAGGAGGGGGLSGVINYSLYEFLSVQR